MSNRQGLSKLEILIPLGIFVLLLALLLPAVQQAREEARSTQVKNNLKQWGLAIHNYESTYGCLPPGGWVRPDGTEMHGWVTVSLPYLESSSLYNDFDLNRPWDDPRNQPMCRLVHHACLNPRQNRVQTAEGYGLCHFAVNPAVMHRNSSIRLDQIAKGLNHTFLIGEAAGDFRPWGGPWNWRDIGERLNDGAASYGSPGVDNTQFALADGEVKAISNAVDPDVLKQLASAGTQITAEAIARPPIPKQYRTDGTFTVWKNRPKGEASRSVSQ